MLNLNTFLIPLQVRHGAYPGNMYDLILIFCTIIFATQQIQFILFKYIIKNFNQNLSLTKQPVKSVTFVFPYATVLIGISSIYRSSSIKHLKLLDYTFLI